VPVRHASAIEIVVESTDTSGGAVLGPIVPRRHVLATQAADDVRILAVACRGGTDVVDRHVPVPDVDERWITRWRRADLVDNRARQRRLRPIS
jgi:hypothetical protein